jgi:hypothetical protein
MTSGTRPKYMIRTDVLFKTVVRNDIAASGEEDDAPTLGLDSYLQFFKGHAFNALDTHFSSRGAETVDMLWCDFGVGSRMMEYASRGCGGTYPPAGSWSFIPHSLTRGRARGWRGSDVMPARRRRAYRRENTRSCRSSNLIRRSCKSASASGGPDLRSQFILNMPNMTIDRSSIQMLCEYLLFHFLYEVRAEAPKQQSDAAGGDGGGGRVARGRLRQPV